MEEKLNQKITKNELLKLGISDKSCDVLIDRCGGVLSWLSFDVYNPYKHIRLKDRGVTNKEIDILRMNVSDNVLKETHYRTCFSISLKEGEKE